MIKFPKPSLQSRRKQQRHANNHKNRHHNIKMYSAWSAKYTPISYANDKEWIDFQTDIARRIAKAFGIPSYLLGEIRQSTPHDEETTLARQQEIYQYLRTKVLQE